jgi:hypothetical protein
MEAFVATDNKQFEVIKKVIDLCDYYILIIGKRYGSINEESGLSYTEMEYNYAKDSGIPILVFAIGENVKLAKTKTEQDPIKKDKLKTFRNRALKNTLASIWTNSEDLTKSVAIAIMQAKNDVKRPGWQRATNYNEASLRREIMELSEKNKVLDEELSKALNEIEEFNTKDNVSIADIEIQIKYEWSQYNRGISTAHSDTKSFKLEEIFKVISTEMLNVSITESAVQATIKNNCLNKPTCTIKDSQLVKRILNHLEMSKLVFSKWDAENKKLYWGLTNKGQKKRDELIVLKIGLN